MQFLAILVALSAALAPALAADICRPASTLATNCNGSLSCCSNIDAGRCCNFGTALRSIRYTLPNNSRGVGHTGSSCTGNSLSFQNPNAATVCRTFSESRASARWLTGLASRIKREQDAGAEACAEPNVVLRVRDGVTTRIELRDGLTVEDALNSDDGEVVETLSVETVSVE